MIAIKPLVGAALTCVLILAASAQQEAATKIRIRAVLHDPLKPFAEMYVRDAKGALVRLNLAEEGLTLPQNVSLSEGSLRLYSSATVDAAKPLANLLALAVVPAGVKQAIVFIVPANGNESPAYRLLVVNDSFDAFPKGESRVINMTQLPLAIHAGEHSREIAPAGITAVPKVTRINDLNQAQTAICRKADDDWVVLSERPMQYTNTLRNLFLIYLMPNVEEPQIRTLIDTEVSR